MSCIVRHVDKKTGNIYLFESRSYRDPETKKVKTNKVYLGKEDPISGKLIPKAPPGKRNRGPSAKQMEFVSEQTKEEMHVLTDKVQTLEETISSLRTKLNSANHFADDMAKALADFRKVLSS